MIGKLTGIIDSIEEGYIILDVNGVGYLINCPTNLLTTFHQGQHITLFIHTLTKDEQILLYGFSNTSQKLWFKELQTVQGVGAKMALAILGSLSANDLSTAIASKDQQAFKRISGVGPKLASRIVNELHGKDAILAASTITSYPASSMADKHILNDAASALSNLGFPKSDVYRVLTEISPQAEGLSLEELIRLALGRLSAHAGSRS